MRAKLIDYDFGLTSKNKKPHPARLRLDQILQYHLLETRGVVHLHRHKILCCCASAET